MVDEVESPRLLKRVSEEERQVRYFEARARYLSTSLIVTIPTKIVRELDIKLGDRVSVQVQKKEAGPIVTLQRRAPST